MPANFVKVPIEQRLKSAPGSKNIVEVKNLDVFFGKGFYKNHAVRNVSFNIMKGEVFGLVGESGSGKTTIGRTIVGLVDFAGGSVQISDLRLPSKNKQVSRSMRKQLVKKVQMIFQDPASSLNPHKVIAKVIREGLDNINVQELFQKRFNDETIATLYKIIPPQHLPHVLKQHQPSFFTDMAIRDPEQLDRIIYVTIYNALKHDHYIRTYIELRRDRKNNLMNEFHSDEKMKEKLVVDIIQAVGLSESMLSRYPLEFSGGQQQRVGIARSIVMQPELIVADEPISSLDVSIQAQVINIFNDLKDKLNLTFLFIAHDLRMVEYISDRIAVIYEGSIIEIGTANEVVNYPLHPYTRSLIGSVPSINIINESLRSIFYDSSQHQYGPSNQPGWFKKHKTQGDHYVYGTAQEVEAWLEESNYGKQ